MQQISITPVPEDQRKQKPSDESQLSFGRLFSDHMFLYDYSPDVGWNSPRIAPYAALSLDPAAMVLHYGQECFEGLKAYRGEDGIIRLFRPQKNLERLQRSARRLCMPQFDADILYEGMKQLVWLEREWIPTTEGCALYIRPNYIATDPYLGVAPSCNYLLYVMVGPVGAYYSEGFKPVNIYVSDTYVRAVKGGVGEAKTAGNYAASLLAQMEAKQKGFDQVLWLDGVERRYVEEVGTMNMFFVIGDDVITSPLTGSILPGVTRDSVLTILRDWGYRVQERLLSIDEVVAAVGDGSLIEAFGTGTAAIISPVGRLTYKGVKHSIAGGQTGALSQKLYEYITGLQYGRIDDPYGWVEVVDAGS